MLEIFARKKEKFCWNVWFNESHLPAPRWVKLGVRGSTSSQCRVILVMRVTKVKYALFIFAMFFAIPINIDAQTSSQSQSSIKPTTCEYLKNALDSALIASRGDETAYIYVVFRPGRKEKSDKYSLKRTGFILNYLKARENTFDRILISQRNAVTDLGTLEINVKGKPMWEIYFRKNKTAWNSCIE